MDTTGFTSAAFAPTSLTGAFAVGFDVSTLAAGDTVGLVSTNFGSASSADASWEQWDDNSWHTLLEAWGEDADLAIAVVFSMAVGNVGDAASLNGLQMTLMNGTVVMDGRLNLSFFLPSASSPRILVHDATGRQVADQFLGSRAAGVHYTSLDMSGLRAGQYYVTLASNGTGLTKKVLTH